VDLGADKNKIHVVPCSPNPIFKYSGNQGNSLSLLAVGRFVEKKAPHLTILAFNKALQSNPDLKLRMIGDGPLLNACKQLIRSLEIEDSVSLLGPKDHNEVVKEMTDTGVFLQHSVEAYNGDSEGTPAVLFEAMSCGVPVIVTKHAGFLEVVEHGKEGFLVDEFDINSMSNYILKLSQNSELAHEMGQNGLKKVQEQFNIDLYIQKFHDIITDAIKG
ncbi:MAG: glycosyltransferase, partial [Chlorobi bacterium]|nr:glycosyltransferase [Chlorobiota bacterium]